jgi:site-specific recombinase XerD
MACVNLFHEDLEALLWITLNKNKEAVSYRTIRKIIKSAAEKIGIKKNVPPHLLYDIRLSRTGF